MNYEQLIEELREEMLQLVNTKCDALFQMYRSGEVHTNVKDTIRESSLIVDRQIPIHSFSPYPSNKYIRRIS